MRKTITSICLVVAIATLTATGIVSAASRHDITGTLGGVVDDYFDLSGTLTVQSVRIGEQGVGGVTFFNGTIVNETTDVNSGLGKPVTFGDDVRIDGTIFRGITEGPGDELPLKLNDDVNVYGTLTVDSTSTLTGAATLAGAVTVGGAATLNGDVTVATGQTLTLTGVATAGLFDAVQTITTDWVNTAYPWSADEIADITRKVDMPIGSLFMLTDPSTIAPLDTTSTPVLTYIADQGAYLVYSEDDTDSVVGSIVVPEDYGSGGVFKMAVDTSSAIVTDWNFDFEVAIGTTTGTEAWDATVDDETAVDVPDTPGEPNIMTFTPTGQSDISAGDLVSLKLTPDTNTATGEPDVEIYALWFEYTAIQ
ncbi:hypothetical protein KKG41_01670 [Patescibacteria group bacterium]|nr:hypothetical protein [Patescibacteria group bacterium]MBU1890485.1 hypothetical protein [Patescibacteria group bacterium]